MHDAEDEIVTTIYVGPRPEQVRPFTSCPSCGIIIDRMCSRCGPPAEPEKPPELTPRKKSLADMQREHDRAVRMRRDRLT